MAGTEERHEGSPAAAGPPRAPVLCVSVSYNSARYLPNHLASLLSQSPPPARVIVVDNASSDGSAALVRSAFPQAEVIANSRNVGYGAAANQGIAVAMEDGLPYVLVANPDLVLEGGGLAALIGALAECPPAAAAGPVVVDHGGRAPEERPADTRGAAALPRSVRWLPGCLLLLRVEALRRVGAFYPGYFLYAEETDLECRLQVAGWTMLAAPAAVAEHVGSGSSRRLLGGARVCYYQVRNAFVFAKRNRRRLGLRACAQTIVQILRSHITPRRLLHPTRLAAIGLGLLSGLWLFAATRPVPAADRGQGPGARGQ